jgi:hypothetical protein
MEKALQELHAAVAEVLVLMIAAQHVPDAVWLRLYSANQSAAAALGRKAQRLEEVDVLIPDQPGSLRHH